MNNLTIQEGQEYINSAESINKAPKLIKESHEQSHNFTETIDALSLDRQAIKHDRELTFTLAILLVEGEQTLLSIYGTEQVLSTMKKLHDTKGTTITTYDLVAELETDKKKRSLLFEKMNSDIKILSNHIQEDEDSNDTGSYFTAMWGGKQNFINAAKVSIANMQSADSILHKLPFAKSRSLLRSRLGDLAHTIFRDEEQEQTFRRQLSEVQGNTLTLIEARDTDCSARNEHIRIQAEKLIKEIQQEITLITQKHNTELEQWRTKVMKDLITVNTVSTTSKEMELALKNALRAVEKEIHNKSELTKQEIEQDTAPLKQMMKQVSSWVRPF